MKTQNNNHRRPGKGSTRAIDEYCNKGGRARAHQSREKRREEGCRPSKKTDRELVRVRDQAPRHGENRAPGKRETERMDLPHFGPPSAYGKSVEGGRPPQARVLHTPLVMLA